MSLGCTAGEVGSTAGEVGLTASEPRFTSWCTGAACTGTRPRWLRVGMLHAGHWVPQLRAHQPACCACAQLPSSCKRDALTTASLRRPLPCRWRQRAWPLAPPLLCPQRLFLGGCVSHPVTTGNGLPAGCSSEPLPARTNSNSKFVPVWRAASPPQLSFPPTQTEHPRPGDAAPSSSPALRDRAVLQSDLVLKCLETGPQTPRSIQCRFDPSFHSQVRHPTDPVLGSRPFPRILDPYLC